MQCFQFILKDNEKVYPKEVVFAPMAWFVLMC